MKKILKVILTLSAMFLLTCILFVSAAAANGAISDFSVKASDADLSSVDWYKSGDGNYYIFLPASADKSNLTVSFSADSDVFCGETKLVNGEATAVFANGNSFVLTCGDSSYKVKVLQGKGAGTIHINTESGNMDAVHADKSHKEPGEVLILDEDGNVQYNGVLDYIKGRGNTTWNLHKKPYNIKLDKKADLFGMGEHKSWCLLASANEQSMIRNKLAYDLGVNMGIATTSLVYHTNLYLNGSYAGVYLITEKVDIGENRVDIYDLEGETEDINDKDLDEYKLGGAQNSRKLGSIKYAEIPNNPDEITGGYLLETEKIYRYVNEASGFITDIGQAVVVKTPEYASKAQVEYISGYYQEFEDALYSPTGYNSLGKHYSEYIDVDALARVYLIYELTANFDGCSSSFYLWKDVDGKLVPGPLWDFDLCLGQALSNDLINHVENTADPNLLYIQTCFIGNHAENKNALLAQAFTHKDFREKVETYWAEEISTYFPIFTRNISTYSSAIVDSVVMDAIFWNTFGTTNTDAIKAHYAGAVNVISNYVNARFPVLNNAYSADNSFVTYDIGKYGSKLVQDTTVYAKNTETAVLKAPSSTNKSYMFTGWTTNPDGTGDRYYAGDRITVNEDVYLYAQWEKTSDMKSLLISILEKISNFFKNIAEAFSKIFS